MFKSVLIKKATYRKQQISNQTYQYISDRVNKDGQTVLKVRGTVEQFPEGNHQGAEFKDINITLADSSDATLLTEEAFINDGYNSHAPVVGTNNMKHKQPDVIQEYLANESDEDAIERIAKMFTHLDKFTEAAIDGIIRGLVVVGPPGIGKTYGVEEILQRANLCNSMANGADKYQVIKGAVSASMLYRKLYEFSEYDNVLVLDDADIEDEESLNLIKAALDSCDKRMISWMKDANWLKRDDIPARFEFKGSIIFLTNVDFANARGKKAIHLNAIVSRCHYYDLELDSQRDRLLRIKQIVGAGMLNEYGFTTEQEEALVDYIWENADHFRETSLRCVKKLADLVKAFPNEWEEFAVSTLMLPSAKYSRLMKAKLKA